MQIARTKGRSIEQSDIWQKKKKRGCTDWFVNDIDVEAAKTIINFFRFRSTNYWKKKKNQFRDYENLRET